MARRAEAFDMRVIAYDPYISEAAAKERQVELVSLEKLLAESDFVSLQYGFESRNAEDDQCQVHRVPKKSARIVTAARGELTDEAALAGSAEKRAAGGSRAGRFRWKNRRKIHRRSGCRT